MKDKTHIKICGITNEKDAFNAAAAGADYLGFIFVPNTPRALTITLAQPIIKALKKAHPHVQTVGVFQNQALAEIQEIVNALNLDFIQLHGDESLADCQQLSIPVIKTIILDSAQPENDIFQKIQTYAPSSSNQIHALLFDLPKGSKNHIGELFTPTLQKAMHHSPAFIAGRLQVDNVSEVVERIQPWGVDVASGVEIQPGQKCVEKMHAFCNTVRNTKHLNQKEKV